MTTQQHQYTLQYVQSLYPDVQLIDKANNLSMYGYVDKEPTQQHVRECRGVVFEGDKLVLKTFPFIQHHEHKDSDKYKDINFDTTTFYESYEGTHVRLYHTQKGWLISTHRKLDAFKSKWGQSKLSFGDMFIQGINELYKDDNTFKERLDLHDDHQVIDKFLKTLDTSHQYVFIVNNMETRMVSFPLKMCCVHLATFKDFKPDYDDYIGVPKPCKVTIKSHEELVHALSMIPLDKLQGLLVVQQDKPVLKLLNSEYCKWLKIRGNTPSVLFRYIELMNDPDKLYHLRKLFPELHQTYKECDYLFTDICNQLHSLYINKFVRHEEIPIIPYHQYQILKKCHSWYHEDRENRRVTKAIVREIMKEAPVSLRYYCLYPSKK